MQNTNSDSQISPARVQYSPTTFTAAFTASFVKRLQWKRDTHNKADWLCNSVNCYFVITQQYIVCILNSWIFCCSENIVLVFYRLKCFIVRSAETVSKPTRVAIGNLTCCCYWRKCHWLWKTVKKGFQESRGTVVLSQSVTLGKQISKS